MSGWQKNSGVWHFHPGGPYWKMSACERLLHTDEPLLTEPTSQIMTCPECVEAMREIVTKLENRRDH